MYITYCSQRLCRLFCSLDADAKIRALCRVIDFFILTICVIDLIVLFVYYNPLFIDPGFLRFI